MEKLDKNKPARTLALKFGRFKKLSSGFGGRGGIAPLAPLASYAPVEVEEYEKVVAVIHDTDGDNGTDDQNYGSSIHFCYCLKVDKKLHEN